MGPMGFLGWSLIPAGLGPGFSPGSDPVLVPVRDITQSHSIVKETT